MEDIYHYRYIVNIMDIIVRRGPESLVPVVFLCESQTARLVNHGQRLSNAVPLYRGRRLGRSRHITLTCIKKGQVGEIVALRRSNKKGGCTSSSNER